MVGSLPKYMCFSACFNPVNPLETDQNFSYPFNTIPWIPQVSSPHKIPFNFSANINYNYTYVTAKL